MHASERFNIYFPEIKSIHQGKEYFFLYRDGRKEKIEFHDYDRIFEIKGLYEHLFYQRYKCNSPKVVGGLLHDHLEHDSHGFEKLLALDIGAGNGMVGEQLAGMGADSIVGVDILDQAAEAAQRDRPGIYDAYHVTDLTRMPHQVENALRKIEFNCMTVVAALGFGDIPPDAFARGYNLVSDRGWVAFNIKEDFVDADDRTGFRRLIRRMKKEGVLDIREKTQYCHRFCQDGTPLYYQAVVGRKQRDIPGDMVFDL